MNLRRKKDFMVTTIAYTVNSSPKTVNLCLLKSYSVDILDIFCIYFGWHHTNFLPMLQFYTPWNHKRAFNF